MGTMRNAVPMSEWAVVTRHKHLACGRACLEGHSIVHRLIDIVCCTVLSITQEYMTRAQSNYYVTQLYMHHVASEHHKAHAQSDAQSVVRSP